MQDIADNTLTRGFPSIWWGAHTLCGREGGKWGPAQTRLKELGGSFRQGTVQTIDDLSCL